jgi:hypothetical protein
MMVFTHINHTMLNGLLNLILLHTGEGEYDGYYRLSGK